MTGNQIAYWNLQEAKRSNLIKEAETERSNRVKEVETNRSNLIKEAETQRHNEKEEIIGGLKVGADLVGNTLKALPKLFI